MGKEAFSSLLAMSGLGLGLKRVLTTTTYDASDTSKISEERASTRGAIVLYSLLILL